MTTTAAHPVRPARAFQHARSHSLEKIVPLLHGLEALHERLVTGAVPGPAYTLDDLEAFVRSAVAGQRGADGFARAGTWALPPDGAIPKEARHEFIMLPTLLVSSILAWFRLHHPARAAAVPGFDEALRAGLTYSVINGLHGPGTYGRDDALVALRLFARSGLTRLVLAEPDLCPELPALLRELKETFASGRDAAGDDGAFGQLTRGQCDEGLRWLG